VDGGVIDDDQVIVELEGAVQCEKINRYYRDQQQ
jgi:hypothetical protein